MSPTICLLRGINVGGKNILKMATLRDILGRAGAEDVKTYIQSGNAVFNGALSESVIQAEIEAETGLKPQIMVVSMQSFDAILATNPFDPPDASHVYFLSQTPKRLSDATRGLATPTEAVDVTDNAAYLNAPDGIGRSKLAAKLEAALGVPATARNWRSCMAIQALAQSIEK